MRFIAVVHKFHVESKGFTVHQLNSLTLHDAQREAAFLERNSIGVCCAAASVVVSIDETETFRSRKLSWRERWSGYLKGEGE